MLFFRHLYVYFICHLYWEQSYKPVNIQNRWVMLWGNLSVFFVFFFVFLFSLTPLSRFFHLYQDEPIERRDEMGVPRKKHLTHPQAEHGLSHMWPVRGSNLHQSQWWDDRMITVRALKFSDLTHSAKGAARNLSVGFLTMSDTNRAVQSLKMARGLKFWI